MRPSPLRSYRTPSASQNDYPCQIWEAGSATAAAPVYFGSVRFETGEEWCDGGMRRNNPVFVVLNETRRIYGTKRIACLLSLGCGVGDLGYVSNSTLGFAKGAIDMMTDAEATRMDFEGSYDGRTLRALGSYFRFSVTRGAAGIELDDWNGPRLKALANLYLGDWKIAHEIGRCRERLLNPMMVPEVADPGLQTSPEPQPAVPPEPEAFVLLRSYQFDPIPLTRNVDKHVKELVQSCEMLDPRHVKGKLGAMAARLELAYNLNVYIYEETYLEHALVSRKGRFIQPLQSSMILGREKQSWNMWYLPKAGLGQKRWQVVHTRRNEFKWEFENQLARGQFAIESSDERLNRVWVWTFSQENSARASGVQIEGWESRAKQRDVVREAVKEDGRLLKDVPSSLKADKDVVLEAVKQHGMALQYASADLQGDKDVVTEAVKEDGLLLQHASSALQGDKEVVLEAIMQNGNAVQFASLDLRGDQEVVLEAVKRDRGSIEYVSAALREDKSVIEAIEQPGFPF